MSDQANRTVPTAPEPMGAPPVFVQTAGGEGKLDQWRQVTEDEAQVAYDMTLRNELSGGTQVVRDFEAEWRRRVGARYAITTMNGTSALHSAMFGVGVGPGDEVITPTGNWICSIAPALMLMARPVFCEIDPATLLIDVDDARRRITERTRAIVAVHLWGNVCDMDWLMRLSRDTGVKIIEDCSHAHGASYRGRPVGGIGHAGAWSFQGTKPVSAGEGGALATNDVDVFERACLIGQVNRMAGMDLVTPDYAHLQPLGLGIKFRAHPVGIGIASVQLRHLGELNARRRNYVEAVERAVASIDGLEPIRVHDGAERAGFYSLCVMHDAGRMGVAKQRFIEALRQEGIGAQDAPYPLLHRLPLFADGMDIYGHGRGPLCTATMGGDYPGYREGDLPVSERVWDNLISLPVLSEPAEGAVETVVASIRKAAEGAGEAG